MSNLALLKRTLLIAVITLAVLALGLTGVRAFSPLFGPPLFSLSQVKTESASLVLLEEMHELLRFNTVQYVYRVVFPYDFMKAGISEASIWESLRSHDPRLAATIPSAKRLADLLNAKGDLRTLGLDADESLWLACWKLCREIGLPYQKPDYAFLVSTIVVEAGFDFTGTVFADPESATAEELGATFWVENGTRAVLKLPKARITDVRIEDRLDGQFPDISLKPSQWKQIAEFISDYYETKPIQEGILADAQKNAAAFVGELLKSSGYVESSVEF